MQFNFFKPNHQQASSPASSGIEKRKHFRFPILYHLNVPVFVRILPYYRSEELEAQLDNLSAGGLGLKLPKVIPIKNFMYIQVRLPNNLCIGCHAEVKHARRLALNEFLIGIEFLDLPSELKDILLKISRAYIACSKKIQEQSKSFCTLECPAYPICNKHEKIRV